MKKFHIALGVDHIEKSVEEYKARLSVEPTVVVAGTYALFRTETLNVSIRKVEAADCGLRHVGWEDETVESFTEETDCNGIVWESFDFASQKAEIEEFWPGAFK